MNTDNQLRAGIKAGRGSLAVICAAAALLAFGPAVQNDWVNWDDPALFLETTGYRGLGPANLRWMLTAMPLGHWAPVSWITHAIDYELWGLDASGHHLTSILFHAANVVVFFYLAVLVLRLAAPRWSRDVVTLGAAAAALFFAVHPMRAESVSWITERRDLVSTFFILLAAYAYLVSRTGGTRKSWTRIALLTYALAVLSKTIAMVVPALLLVLDFYPLRRISSRRSWWAALTEKVPFLLLGAFAAGMAAYGQRDIAVSLEVRGALDRVAAAIYGAAFYLGKTLWPHPISPLYEITTGPKAVSLPVLLSAVAVLAVGLVAYKTRLRWPAIGAAFAAYLISLAPVSGLTQAGPQLVAARYTYLSGLSIALLVGGAVALFLDRNRNARSLRLPLVLAISIAAIFITLTRDQVRVWRNSGTLWTHTLSLFPNSPIANHNLGLFLWLNGDAERGPSHIRRALELQPGYLDAIRNLSIIAFTGDTLTRAEADFASQLADAGQFEFAADVFRRRLTMNPNDVVSRNNLGVIYVAKGDTASAIRQFEEALKRQPAYHDARFNLEAVRPSPKGIAP